MLYIIPVQRWPVLTISGISECHYATGYLKTKELIKEEPSRYCQVLKLMKSYRIVSANHSPYTPDRESTQLLLFLWPAGFAKSDDLKLQLCTLREKMDHLISTTS